MSGASIAAEVKAALQEVADDVGDGEFTITLKVPAAQPDNPWDAAAGADTDVEVPALIQSYPRGMVDGTLIRSTDKRVMIAADTVPTVAMSAVIADKTHEIVSVNEVAPSGVALYYEVQARI